MKSFVALLFVASLALSSAGCGGGMDASIDEAKKAELNAAMDADMAKMTGQLSEKVDNKKK